MGQAKLRGTYEQRKAEGEARHAEEKLKRQEAMQKLEESLTPKQRANRHRARMLMAYAASLGIVALDGR